MRYIKFQIGIILLAFSMIAVGQLPDIVAMEYYFDSDPGYSNGIMVPVTGDSLIEVSFDADMTSVSNGFHILNVRVKDENGIWSTALTEKVFKFSNPLTWVSGTLPQITQMEYFFDSDPGFGNGVDIPLTSDSLVEVVFDADFSALSMGFHTLFVRTMDEQGKWSTAFTSQILKFSNPQTGTSSTLPQITQMEYFFDSDPGFGNGFDIPIDSDSLVEVVFDSDFSTVNMGFHTLFIRTKDEHGIWSTAFTTQVLKFTNPLAGVLGKLPLITEIEYFFDSDPGFGNGFDIPTTSDSIIEAIFDVDFSSVSMGFHTLFVRVNDEFGNWNIAFTDDVYKFSNPEEGILYPLPAITHIEYFFDNDPGFGNGSQLIISPDSIVLEDFLADISAIGTGPHLMYLRVQDELGRWSQSIIEPFCKMGLTVILEGPFDPNLNKMSTSLNSKNVLPLEQPFDSNVNAEWYYEGDEAVASIPNADIVDWLLLQARDAVSTETATPETTKETQVAFLLKNGVIVGLDGESLISFNEPIQNDLFLVVFQRNHASVMSSASIEQTGDCECTFNFSTAEGQVYGGSIGHKEIAPGVWAMFGGDGDGNGNIDNDDKINIWISQSGKPAGYEAADYNFDGQVDNQDKNDSWAENANKSSQVPE